MGEWQNGLFGCFNNFGVCIITYFVPCVTAGKNAEAVGESCFLYGCLYLVFPPFFGAQIRGKIRDQKGIDGSFVNDFILHWCCGFCALVQEGQEIEGSGGPQAQSMSRE